MGRMIQQMVEKRRPYDVEERLALDLQKMTRSIESEDEGGPLGKLLLGLGYEVLGLHVHGQDFVTEFTKTSLDFGQESIHGSVLVGPSCMKDEYLHNLSSIAAITVSKALMRA